MSNLDLLNMTDEELDNNPDIMYIEDNNGYEQIIHKKTHGITFALHKGFFLFDDKHPNIFKRGKIKSNFMTLIRMHPDECPLSGICHEHDNMYLVINETSTSYRVSIGCNRGCTWTSRNIKVKNIGIIKK